MGPREAVFLVKDASRSLVMIHFVANEREVFAFMSQENNYYVVSKTGFGGPGFRVTEKYLWKSPPVAKNPRFSVEADEIVTIKRRTSARGELLKIQVRPDLTPSSPKVRVALFSPADPSDFEAYCRNKSQEFSLIDVDPVEFALTTLCRLLNEEPNMTPTERLIATFKNESRFPIQNFDELINRVSKIAAEGRSLRIGCFACLNMKCMSVAGKPVNYVGQEETRLEAPRISSRTQELMGLLTNSGVPFIWEFILADTDAEEIYGDWLPRDQSEAINTTISRIKPQKLWSQIRSRYRDQYQADFRYAYENCEQLVGSDYLQVSVNRRLDYFITRVGLPDSLENRAVCETTAKRNIAAYAAQGPIIAQEYDCLVIADPDPTRLGMIQSLLTPTLTIWYPYSG